MIQIIDKSERRDEIISLWQECFGDEKEYICYFLDCCKSDCLGFVKEGKLVSMLFLLDGFIKNNSVRYIYAACTLKKFRGMGLMGKLIEASKKLCEETEYDALFLVPGEDSLYDYYSKFGFIPQFRRSVAELKNTSLNTDLLNEITDVNTTVKIRSEILSEYDCFVFDEKTMKYSIKEHMYNGGKIYSAVFSGKIILLFALKRESEIYIKELLFNKSVKMSKIIEHFTNKGKENIYIQCPIVYNSTDKMVKYAKCGMYCPLTDRIKEMSADKVFYAGLYLD
ncbi:MAG: GNAT family N-acetyltransferase [Clostridia bacterium]|nr:GNAT family N-acetyltransferase [Clostridia bacterium]